MNLPARGMLASEWIKLRTVRSTWLTLALSALVAVLLGLVDYHNAAADWNTLTPARRAAFDPVRYGYSGGFYLVVIAFGILGVLSISSEYGTGLIRTTFTASPRRPAVLAAKTAVIATVTLATGELLAFAVYFLGQAVLSGKDLNAGLGDPGVLRAVLATGTFLTAFALTGLGLGALLRRSAGAIAGLFGLFFVLPILAGSITENSTVSQWMLQSAFESLSSTQPLAADRPSIALACLVCTTYATLSLSAAAVLLTRRDA